jgi:8-oxo-dGTP pyrophosphatase MutT (NUDIX family)
VLVARDGKVLAISRGLDIHDLGLPGGRSDPEDRSARHTAARELYEETGVEVYAPRLQYLASNVNHHGGTYVVFLAREIVSWPATLRSTPFEGYVGWHSPEALLAPGVTHRAFYRKIFALWPQVLTPHRLPRFRSCAGAIGAANRC